MASAATFDELETRTYWALAETGRARRAVREAQFRGTWCVYASLLTFFLRRLVSNVTATELRTFDTERAQGLIENLQKLHSMLNEMLGLAEQERLSQGQLCGRLFRTIQNDTARLGDVLESYYLSLDPDFQRMVKDAIGQLKPKQGRPSDWKSSLAAMQD